MRRAHPGGVPVERDKIAALAGATLPWMQRELTVTPADREAAAQVLPPDGWYAAHVRLPAPGSTLPASPQGCDRPLLLQPGSSDPRRCWPAERFIAVGDVLAEAFAQLQSQPALASSA